MKAFCLFALLIFCHFLIGQNFQLNGTVQDQGGACYQLTDALNNQVGSIFSTELIDLNEDFTFEFSINFGSNPGGADGMIFVLQNFDPVFLGTSGGGIGYEGSPVASSIAVEFDTWQNAERNDPLVDHTAIISNGSTDHNLASNLAGPVQMSASNSNVEDGMDHLLMIEWDSTNQILTVNFDCEERIALNLDIVQSIFGGENLVYWGFTGSTGGANNIQSFCLAQEIEASFPENCVDEGTFVLTAPGLNTHVYTWTPDITTISSNNQIVIADISETTEFTYTSIDPCDGSSEQGSFTIYVNNLEVEVSSNTINCYSDTLQLVGSVNQNDNLLFNWTASSGQIISGENQSSAIGQGAGVYTLTVTDSVSNCSRSFAYEAPTNFTAPELFSFVDGLLSCLNPIVEIEIFEQNGLTDLSYNWRTQNGDIISTAENTALVGEEATYQVEVVYLESGCSSSIESFAQNDPDFLIPYEAIEMPNVISSNGDLINDDFKAFLTVDPSFLLNDKFGTYQLNVFNRWGIEVFDSSQPEFLWNTNDVSEGVYFYTFKYADLCETGDFLLKKGTVEILK